MIKKQNELQKKINRNKEFIEQFNQIVSEKEIKQTTGKVSNTHSFLINYMNKIFVPLLPLFSTKNSFCRNDKYVLRYIIE